jgi:hypothetical protein
MKKTYAISIIAFSLLLIPVVTAAATLVHPVLLFHNINEVPGYQYRSTEPWKKWEADILSSADKSLSRDFSANLGSYDHISTRGELAQDLGMAYQITKNPTYALKAREALLHMETGTIGVDSSDSNANVRAKSDKARALAGYSLAYDWVQPTADPATDLLIRDNLAMLADTVYKDLNDNGTNLNYVSFPDHLGQAYPTMGVASAVLSDYTNPNNLQISSTPAEWHRTATEYLFEKDTLHSYNTSLFSFGFDETSGKYLNGAYKSYVMDDLALWFQVSSHAYGENLLDKYPAAKKGFTSEVWESLPNDYSDNYVTNGNTKWIYHKAIISLLPDSEKSNVLNHLDRVEKSTLLPYSSVSDGGSQGGLSSAFLYCVYGNYANIPRTFPANTSHLDPNAITQVFRGSWNDDADWLSLITFNKVTRSNRDMAHHDQLSFEYYSRGDLLLADGGEPKNTLAFPAGYGYFDIFHNTIAIENPRSPFPVSLMSGSSSLGVYKGYNVKLVTPPAVGIIIEAPWIQALQTHVSITKLSAGTAEIYSTQNLSSPVQYTRTILYPDSDYFIILDRMEGTEDWVYRNIFRPTSLSIVPTDDTNKDGVYTASEVGHVNGDLTIGTTPFSWQSLPYKTETVTGTITNSVSWVTKNPYGKNVRLNLVSAPASEILITKHIGRIGGYGSASEVYNPVVYLKSPSSKTLYRVTALLSSYSGEETKSAMEIPVQGTGNALNVHSTNYDDFIYTGQGSSSFDNFSTDAEVVFVRKFNEKMEITLLKGSFFDYQDMRLVNISKKADYLTFQKAGNSLDYLISKDQNPGELLFLNATTINVVSRPNNTEAKPTPPNILTLVVALPVIFIIVRFFVKKK